MAGIVILVVIMLFMLMAVNNTKREMKAKQDFIKRCEVEGIDSIITDDIKEMANSGKIIPALREIRKKTGLGLKDAREVLDKIIDPAKRKSGTEVSDAVKELLHSGNKIGAIKLLREENGIGLKEAKDILDRM